MSLTSYQAAPPRDLFETQGGSVLETRNLISEIFQTVAKFEMRPVLGKDQPLRVGKWCQRSLDKKIKKENL